jgi:hypothetical protein
MHRLALCRYRRLKALDLSYDCQPYQHAIEVAPGEQLMSRATAWVMASPP